MEQRLKVDLATGRPLVDGRDDAFEALTESEIEIELTVAASDARRRGRRLDALLQERTRRRRIAGPSL